MHCKYLAKDGMCIGMYPGYACIKKHCVSYKEAQNCQFREATGDYCRKYSRFGCVGRDSCQTLSDYLLAVAEEELA